MLQRQCWDSNVIIECPEGLSEAANSSIRMENVTRAIPSTTDLRKDPLYSQVNTARCGIK